MVSGSEARARSVKSGASEPGRLARYHLRLFPSPLTCTLYPIFTQWRVIAFQTLILLPCSLGFLTRIRSELGSYQLWLSAYILAGWPFLGHTDCSVYNKAELSTELQRAANQVCSISERIYKAVNDLIFPDFSMRMVLFL